MSDYLSPSRPERIRFKRKMARIRIGVWVFVSAALLGIAAGLLG